MEEWRDVIGYEGAYQVSSLGRVKSLRRSAKIRGGRVRNIKTRFLMPSKDRGGYSSELEASKAYQNKLMEIN